ncbi:hypothetical protein TWF506_008227 [Arthrobotrys conoides]|uniref:Uncharacterized protein n=1 Tax=Arthrobotrys conoides TaxID=74498 RepID=A0AAN8N900_9PEZI
MRGFTKVMQKIVQEPNTYDTVGNKFKANFRDGSYSFFPRTLQTTCYTEAAGTMKIFGTCYIQAIRMFRNDRKASGMGRSTKWAT